MAAYSASKNHCNRLASLQVPEQQSTARCYLASIQLTTSLLQEPTSSPNGGVTCFNLIADLRQPLTPEGLASDLFLLVPLWQLHLPGNIRTFSSHLTSVETFDALLRGTCVYGVSYNILSELIWGFLYAVEKVRGDFTLDTTVGLLKRVARILSPSPPSIDKTIYDYWRTRLEGKSHENTLHGEPERLSFPFLNWSDADSVPFMC